eukprot:7379611-Pyramimonas_sp.AAC.1
MRLILTKAGLDDVRLGLVKGVCDTCRECRALNKPEHAVLPSVALPGKFAEEAERGLMLQTTGI